MNHDVVKAILATQEHLLVGEVPTRGQRLLESLADPRTAFLHIRNVRICRRAGGSEIVKTLDQAVVVKDLLGLAVIGGNQHEAPNVRRNSFVEKQSSSAFLVVAGFEVCGHMHYRGTCDPVALLSREMRAFIPITKATVAYEGGAPLAAGVVLVNKAFTSVLHLQESARNQDNSARNQDMEHDQACLSARI
jgi:hypothetical protein